MAFRLLWPILVLMHNVYGQRGCGYRELAGTTEYVYNTEYPKYSEDEDACLLMKSALGTQNFLSCDVDITASTYCKESFLELSAQGDTSFRGADRHCGTGQFSMISQNNSLALKFHIQRKRQQRGLFFCTITILKPSAPLSTSLRIEDSMCSCGGSTPEKTRIVGGEETKVNEFPFMVAIILKTAVADSSVWCGATIISDRYAVTAAHCVASLQPSGIYLLVGDHDITTGNDTKYSALYNIQQIVIYPEFQQTPTIKNDIALLYTTQAMKFSASVGPVCLPFRYSFDSFDGFGVTILGWGQLQFSGRSSKTLQKALVMVISQNECQQSGVEGTLSDGDICTYSDNGKDSCQNDSGGPVIWRDSKGNYQLIGIISNGPGCAAGYPGVNTRVTEYLQWIVQTTNAFYCIK